MQVLAPRFTLSQELHCHTSHICHTLGPCVTHHAAEVGVFVGHDDNRRQIGAIPLLAALALVPVQEAAHLHPVLDRVSENIQRAQKQGLRARLGH